jgi:polygalacturonase
MILDVRSYGATGSGMKLETPQINAAIEAADAAGGGHGVCAGRDDGTDGRDV